MDFSKIPVFNMLTKRMAWLGARQRILAQNLANANTPKYTALDLKETDFRKVVLNTYPGKMQLVKRTAGHINGLIPPGVTQRTERAPGAETTPAGNSVVIEEQMMKMAETRMQYKITSNLYRKHINLIKTALGSNQR